MRNPGTPSSLPWLRWRRGFGLRFQKEIKKILQSGYPPVCVSIKSAPKRPRSAFVESEMFVFRRKPEVSTAFHLNTLPVQHSFGFNDKHRPGWSKWLSNREVGLLPSIASRLAHNSEYGGSNARFQVDLPGCLRKTSPIGFRRHIASALRLDLWSLTSHCCRRFSSRYSACGQKRLALIQTIDLTMRAQG